jgi:hypothetical protein
MFKGLGPVVIGTILVLTVLGALTGLALADVDLLNPYTSQAEADRTERETEIYFLRAAFDLKIHMREEIARVEHEIQLLAQELVHRDEEHRANLVLMEERETTLTYTLAGTLLMIGGGITFCLVALGRRLWTTQQPIATDEWRAMAIRLARANGALLQHMDSRAISGFRLLSDSTDSRRKTCYPVFPAE